jgi:hypothetical protein
VGHPERGRGCAGDEGLGHGVPVAEMTLTAGALEVDGCPGAGGAHGGARGPVAGPDVHGD